MTMPIVGFAGMTHLGIVTGVCAAEKGFKVICFDPEVKRINELNQNKLPVSEPLLEKLVIKNKLKIQFTSNIERLKSCDVVYVAPDVSTDDEGQSDLLTISTLLEAVFDATESKTVIVILSQVPPGYSRQKQRSGRALYYQVETLIFGRAVERAIYPERYIIGCADANKPITGKWKIYLDSYNCPLLTMRYESAELAKISINMCLVSAVTTANTLAEICEKIGANWSEIVEALKLDKRIGPFSYLNPGLGIAGGNLERDLATVCNFANKYGTDDGVVRAWIANSEYRRNWPIRILHEKVFNKTHDPNITIWGLSYKENTNSIKNSPSINLIKSISEYQIRFYDPVVPYKIIESKNIVGAKTEIEACEKSDVLIIITPWEQFRKINPSLIAKNMRGKLVIDPYNVLSKKECINAGLEYITLGQSY